jgi:hypothetical protein
MAFAWRMTMVGAAIAMIAAGILLGIRYLNPAALASWPLLTSFIAPFRIRGKGGGPHPAWGVLIGSVLFCLILLVHYWVG